MRIGQRVKIVAESLLRDGITYGDVQTIHGDGYITVLTIHPQKTERFMARLGPQDYSAVPGKPPFVHIDGPRPNFGANRKGTTQKPSAVESTVDSTDTPTPKDSMDSFIKILKNAIEEAVSAKVAEKLKDMPSSAPGSVVVQVGDLPPVEVEGTPHKLLKRILRLIAANVSDKNVLLIGPAGSGKTYLAEQVSKVLGLDFAALSFSPGMSEAKLLGRIVPNISTGTESYVESPAIRAYRSGGVVLLDELDNGDPSVVTVLNAFLANGWMYLPSGERVNRHPDTVVIGSMNTLGTGADKVYVGRNALDGATLDRFVIEMMDYDADLEKSLCPEDEIRDAILALRKSVSDHKLRRIVGTRMLRMVRSLVLAVGDSLPDALKVATANWNDADRKLCGIA
jgi:cobaltochelatase CobS